ncbi:hypothetical protein EVAR_10372_1 [Eumeta japonica]|uniref:Uncharacterized protein n=1 Tax=Eumeta variegata TaxID=151549 RepID=A0A4C1UCR4_EUMVA|nr:hypothetical protein EVAR_10372_1 [Eumeta japonica]
MCRPASDAFYEPPSHWRHSRDGWPHWLQIGIWNSFSLVSGVIFHSFEARSRQGDRKHGMLRGRRFLLSKIGRGIVTAVLWLELIA